MNFNYKNGSYLVAFFYVSAKKMKEQLSLLSNISGVNCTEF